MAGTHCRGGARGGAGGERAHPLGHRGHRLPRKRRTRLLGLSVGLSRIPVLLHGVVLWVLPATSARVAVVLTIWAGAAATAVGLAVFFELLERGQTVPSELV